MKIWKLPLRFDVTDLLWALQANPQLWDTRTGRTAPSDSPHHGLSDIWVRWVDEPGSTAMAWDSAAEVLPVRPLVEQLCRAVGAVELGGVLITRIPAGAECKPHVDTGWHAERYEKYGVQVQSGPGQVFCFHGEQLVTKPGDVFWFDNAHEHWVPNNTPYDRITMIVCLRREVS